jgi:C_GCAxxG_C_C family probable redox protein
MREHLINPESSEKIAQKAYDLAYYYEQKNGSCAQCVIASIQEVFDCDFSTLFEASYGLGAGGGLTSKGTCGALNGMMLLIGALIGRERPDFHLQRNPGCFTVCREVLLEFEKKYGCVTCAGVQTKIMGKSYNLSVPEEFEAYEAAGGHDDKCTDVVGQAARKIAELILSGELPM